MDTEQRGASAADRDGTHLRAPNNLHVISVSTPIQLYEDDFMKYESKKKIDSLLQTIINSGYLTRSIISSELKANVLF